MPRARNNSNTASRTIVMLAPPLLAGARTLPCANAPLRLAYLGQLLQGPAAVRAPRLGLRPPRGRRRRPLEPPRAARGGQPWPARAERRPRRRAHARRVERDPRLLRRR